LRWRPADLPVEQPTKFEHLWGARARWRKGLEPTMVWRLLLIAVLLAIVVALLIAILASW
jgi:hypothetical protein